MKDDYQTLDILSEVFTKYNSNHKTQLSNSKTLRTKNRKNDIFFLSVRASESYA
jgi:pSer/pThr/pTyr-binding forkhead associated (FHA) protein